MVFSSRSVRSGMLRPALGERQPQDLRGVLVRAVLADDVSACQRGVDLDDLYADVGAALGLLGPVLDEVVGVPVGLVLDRERAVHLDRAELLLGQDCERAEALADEVADGVQVLAFHGISFSRGVLRSLVLRPPARGWEPQDQAAVRRSISTGPAWIFSSLGVP